MAGTNRLNGKARHTDWVPKPLRLSNGDIGVVTEPLGSVVPAGRCRWEWTEGPKAGRRCKRTSVWGIGLCDRHGGRDPERHEKLRKDLERVEQLLTLESMLKRLMWIMDADASLFHDEETGELMHPRDWPPEAWQIYKSAKVLNYSADPTDGEPQRVVELQVRDKKWAFELAAKIAGLIVDRQRIDGRVQHDHKVSQPLIDALLEGKARTETRGAIRSAPAPEVLDGQVLRREGAPVER